MQRAGVLENRVALVTGAGRGIGRAIAIGYGREGARVAVASRTAPELETVVREICAAGGEALAIPADLVQPEECRRVVARVVEAFGTIDILVNNAGVGSSPSPRPLLDYDDAFWDFTLALNLSAPFHLCRAVAPILYEKKWGRIINVASIAGKIGVLHAGAYTASKHGLLGLTRTLALELAKDGITVNAICPGPVKTVMSNLRVAHDARRLGTTVEEIEKKITPQGRRLDPEEMVPMAVLLASEKAAGITGQAFNVCGGALMAG